MGQLPSSLSKLPKVDYPLYKLRPNVLCYMVSMYLPFFNLNEKPFTYLTPNPRFLYYAPQYLSIKRKTEYVVSERSGHLYLYGPIGSGKTTLLKTISQMLVEDERNVVNFLNAPNLKTANSLLRRICSGFGVKTERSYSASLENFTAWLVEQHRAHRFPVLIIDEAQNVVRDGLKTLHYLMTYVTNEELASDDHPLRPTGASGPDRTLP